MAGSCLAYASRVRNGILFHCREKVALLPLLAGRIFILFLEVAVIGL
jgi:hypothetical protein